MATLSSFKRILLLISVYSLLVTPTPAFSEEDQQPLSTLVKSLGTFPACFVLCSGDLFLKADEIIKTSITTKRFVELCQTFAASQACITSNSGCSHHLELYNDVTSGLEYACHQEYDSFLTFLPCIEQYVTRPQQTVDCEHQCSLHSNIFKVLRSNQLARMQQQNASLAKIIGLGGPICESLSCYLKCTRLETNKHCATSGTKLVETVVRPLDQLSDHFRKSSPQFQEQLRKNLPEECRQFITPRGLDEIRFDEEFMDKLRVLIASRKTQLISTAYNEESEQIIRELLTPRKRTENVQAEWDLVNCLYLAFIVSVLTLNIAGLVISVMWCLRGETLPEEPSLYEFNHHLNRRKVRMICNAAQIAPELDSTAGNESSKSPVVATVVDANITDNSTFDETNKRPIIVRFS